MWVRDDMGLSCSYAFSQQLTAGRSFHQFLITIARLAYLFSSSSFSSISMTYHNQLLTIWTMCTRSVWRVLKLVPWINTTWRLSCRQIRIDHWARLLWLVWHHSFNFCLYISLLILLLRSHLTLISKQKSSWLAILQHDLDSITFTWCVHPLHMHTRIIMSHSVVTKIKKKMTRSKIGTQITFHWDIMSKMTICLSIPPLAQKQSPSLRPNPIAI